MLKNLLTESESKISLPMDNLDLGFQGHRTHNFVESEDKGPVFHCEDESKSVFYLSNEEDPKKEGASPKSLLGGLLDANAYATKKTIAQGMLDVALLTANASQLKYLLQVGQKHDFYHLMMSLICISIILQLVAGAIMFVTATYNINLVREQPRADRLNNWTTIAIFLVVALNVFISAFGMAEWPQFPNSDFGEFDIRLSNQSTTTFEP